MVSALSADRLPARRDPLSFPTRRSSDLACVRGGIALEIRRRDGERLDLAIQCVGRGDDVRELLAHVVPSADALYRKRSEEHTSELQSRLHLVCRLLLEKKKRRRDRQRRE